MIKNIILDLGGVIIDIDYAKTSRAFLALGADQFEKYYSQKGQDSLFDELETGQISEVTFRDKLKNLLKIEVTNEQIDAAWNAMLLEIPNNRLSYLRQLSRKYQLFLFSNTNAIHMNAINKKIKNNTDNPQNLESYFIKAYYSYLFGYRKPDPESFLKIIKLNHLKINETVFVDDSLQHIRGAQQAGLHTIHLTSPHDLTTLQQLIHRLEEKHPV